jgi:hypothetical protein
MCPSEIPFDEQRVSRRTLRGLFQRGLVAAMDESEPDALSDHRDTFWSDVAALNSKPKDE